MWLNSSILIDLFHIVHSFVKLKVFTMVIIVGENYGQMLLSLHNMRGHIY